MPKIDFSAAVEKIVDADPRYHREGYLFLRNALDWTLKSRKKQRQAEPARHVSGEELLEGLRLYALQEFGPMVPTVFAAWGIATCADFGEMVFNLVRIGAFGKTDRDNIADFQNGYDFHDAFVQPYLPEPQPPVRRAQKPAVSTRKSS